MFYVPGSSPEIDVAQAVRGLDLNETPARATQALLRAESLPRHLWDFGAGRGAIVRELRAAGLVVTTSDIVERNFLLDFVGGFLAVLKLPRGCTGIVTNPPYSRAVLDPFVRHAIDLSPRVYLLLRLSFLEAAAAPTSWSAVVWRGSTCSATACR